jgi:hypothetical protein
LEASERLLELAQQRRPLFELRVYCARHTPRRERTRRKSHPRKPKLSPRRRSTIRLFSSFISTSSLANSSRNRFITANSSQSWRVWASINTTRSSVESRGAFDSAHWCLGYCSQVFRYAIATARAKRNPSVVGGCYPPVRSGKAWIHALLYCTIDDA